MIRCTTPTKRFLLLQMLEWKVEMAACYHIKREAGAAGGGWGDSGARRTQMRDAALLGVSFQPLVGFGNKKKTLIRDLDLVNYWEMRPECAALLSGSCCFNEQLLRTNSDSRWPIIGTALTDSTIFMYRKYFKTKPGFEIEICRGSFATAENIC